MLVNRLLASLPASRAASAFPGLERVELAFGQVLHQSHQRIHHVYFPVDSLVSLVAHARGDVAVELGVIGRDGMLGVGVAMGDRQSAFHAIVQAAGCAQRATSADFMKEFRRRTDMRRDVRRYSNDLTIQVMQTASCNRNHSAEQRLARWLLMMRDRLSGDRYRLTQQYLGFMLGIRRAAISEAAGLLQRRKLIRYARGSIQILDGPGLKAASCACYRVWSDRPAPRSA
jgi:CRP-like cAMP-binding protein